MNEPSTSAEWRSIDHLHAIFVLLPLWVFIILHSAFTSCALGGHEIFERAELAALRRPAWPIVEGAFVFVPLALHVAFEVHCAIGTRRDSALLGRGALRTMRVTGIAALVFIAYHLWEYRIQRLFFGMRAVDLYSALAANLSSANQNLPIPWRALGAIGGVACVLVHLALGSYEYTVGLCRFEHARRTLSRVWIGLSASVWVLFFVVIVHFATGIRFRRDIPLPPSALDAVPCPTPVSAHPR